ADYPLNNAWFLEREYADLLRERIRVIQPLLEMVQPYRKSPALRLFTERQSRDRFPADKVNEAYRELRALIEKIGPPPGWPDGEAPVAPEFQHAIPADAKKRGAEPETEGVKADGEDSPKTDADGEAGEKPFPKSPVDYSKRV
ncbi:MAG: hypothetical protein V3S64_00765, partial [bacterium]